MSPEFSSETWSCLTSGIPLDDEEDPEGRKLNRCPFPDGGDLCTGDGYSPAPTPVQPVLENPLGECRCDGELWVSEGCSFAYYCNSNQANGGQYIDCPVSKTVSLQT